MRIPSKQASRKELHIDKDDDFFPWARPDDPCICDRCGKHTTRNDVVFWMSKRRTDQCLCWGCGRGRVEKAMLKCICGETPTIHESFYEPDNSDQCPIDYEVTVKCRKCGTQAECCWLGPSGVLDAIEDWNDVIARLKEYCVLNTRTR